MCPSLWGEGVRPWGGKAADFADLDLPERRLSVAWFGLGAGFTDVHVHSVEARNRLRKLLTVSPLVCVLVLLWAPCPNLVVMCGIGRSWDVMTVDYVCSHLALLYHGYSKGSCRNFPAFCDTLLAFIFIPFCCLAAYSSVWRLLPWPSGEAYNSFTPICWMNQCVILPLRIFVQLHHLGQGNDFLCDI